MRYRNSGWWTLVVCFLFFLTANIFASHGGKIQETKTENKRVEIKLPFYFPAGVIQTKDPVKQMQEYVRYITATSYRFQGSGQGSQKLIPGSDSIVVETDIDSTSSVASSKSQKCRIVLDHFVRMSDGKIRVTQLADQFFITEEELKIVSDDLIQLTKEASQDNYEFYKELSDLAFKARAEKILSTTRQTTQTSSVTTTSISTAEFTALQKMLDEKDPLYGEVTLRELHYLPKRVQVSDFVPRELHLGYNPEIQGILGVCWLNSGVIYYNPQARILDYLTGRPKVLQHEMVHCNPNLEKFPLASGFDAELFAMFPEVFFEENKIDLFFHNYCEDLRELCEIYFGFDFAEAKRQIFKYNLAGSMLIDEAKYQEYSKRIEEIKKELSRVVKEHIIPEFYSDPLWWSSMHDKLRDSNGLFWIMMARHYRPTILGGSKDTSVWLSAHHEEIMEMAKDAFKKSGTEGRLSIAVGNTKVSETMLDELSRLLSSDEKRRIIQYFENDSTAGKRLEGMSINEAINFIRTISQKRTGVMEIEN